MQTFKYIVGALLAIWGFSSMARNLSMHDEPKNRGGYSIQQEIGFVAQTILFVGGLIILFI